MNAKVRGTLVPPCPDLPRFVHHAQSVKTGWTDEQKARHSVTMRAAAKPVASDSKSHFTDASDRTAQKYVPELHALKRANPTWTQTQLGGALGIAQGAVSLLLKRYPCTSA